MYDGDNRLELFEDPTIHTYSVPMAKEAAAFFSKHLLGKQLACTWEGIQPIDPKRLWCTASGQVRGDRDDVRGVHEENLDRLADLEKAAAAVPDNVRKERAIAWLRDRVYGGRRPCALGPRRVSLGKLDEELTAESVLWWSQTSLFNHGFMFRSSACAGVDAPVTIGLWARGTKDLEPHLEWIRETCGTGRAVFVLDVSGDGAVIPNSITTHGDMHDFYGTIHKFTIDLFWLDDSLAAVRTFDVIRALDIVELLSGGAGKDIGLYAAGKFSLYGRLAEALDDRLKRVDTVNGIGSIAEWVRSRYYDPLDSEGMVMPGMLHYFDLPDLERWRRAQAE
jgi:hypothetical protein